MATYNIAILSGDVDNLNIIPPVFTDKDNNTYRISNSFIIDIATGTSSTDMVISGHIHDYMFTNYQQVSAMIPVARVMRLSKITQSILLKRKGVNHPKTYGSFNNEGFIEPAELPIGVKLLLKDEYGARGTGQVIIDSYRLHTAKRDLYSSTEALKRSHPNAQVIAHDARLETDIATSKPMDNKYVIQELVKGITRELRIVVSGNTFEDDVSELCIFVESRKIISIPDFDVPQPDSNVEVFDENITPVRLIDIFDDSLYGALNVAVFGCYENLLNDIRRIAAILIPTNFDRSICYGSIDIYINDTDKTWGVFEGQAQFGTQGYDNSFVSMLNKKLVIDIAKEVLHPKNNPFA